MSDKITKRMLELYQQMASPTRFLTGLFQTPARNFYNSAEVEIDIIRTGEDISIVVEDLSTDGRMNTVDLYTNKKFKPPIHKEKGALNSFDMINRQAGSDPFADFDYQAVATLRAMLLGAKMEDKIRRSIELQASQVLQTGVVSLADENGTVLYTIDYKPKATHFPDATPIWSDSSATPLEDLESLADVIRTDGLMEPDQIIMGSSAFAAFIANDEVKSRFDNRRYELGTIAPMEMRGNGGKYRGQVTVGNYNLDIWSYNGFYKDPETGNSLPYLDKGKVIMRASVGRMDGTFGAIPTFGNPAAGILPYLPPRIASVTTGLDLFANAWLTPSREQLIVSIGSRPLLIPTAIDTFGCLDAGV